MMSSAALTRSAVSSTMQGGFPAPAPITFAAFQPHHHNARPAGNRQQGNFRVRHHLLRGFERWFGDRHHQLRIPVLRKAISSIMRISFSETFFAPVWAKVDGVARSQHADAVIDNGLRGVGTWRNRANNAKRGVFEQHHAAVAGQGGSGEILNAGCFPVRLCFSETCLLYCPCRFRSRSLQQAAPDTVPVPREGC